MQYLELPKGIYVRLSGTGAERVEITDTKIVFNFNGITAHYYGKDAVEAAIAWKGAVDILSPVYSKPSESVPVVEGGSEPEPEISDASGKPAKPKKGK